MVLFLFVIWLLNIQVDPGSGGQLGLKLFGAVVAAAMAAEFAEVIEHTPKISQIATVPADFGSVAELARYLFTDYLVAFEVTSVLLLAAVVGAIALARRVSASLVLVPPVAARGATSPPEPDVPVARQESA
jgi:NADH-quinone oxidoreductase subunit J